MFRWNTIFVVLLLLTVLSPILYFTFPKIIQREEIADGGGSNVESNVATKGLPGIIASDDRNDSGEELPHQNVQEEEFLGEGIIKDLLQYQNARKEDFVGQDTMGNWKNDDKGDQYTNTTNFDHQEPLGGVFGKVDPENYHITDARVRQFKDQLAVARLFLEIELTKSRPRFIGELLKRIADVENVLHEATTKSGLSEDADRKLKAMEETLSKGKQILDDCTATEKSLRAELRPAKEQLRTETRQNAFLNQLLAKTLPKGLHCLSLRLSIEYYSLNSTQKYQFPHQQKLEDTKLYHYALFTDNVLAAAVVVNSTLHNAKNPEDHVFHVVTDELNYAAIKMWFLSNLPGNTTIQVQKIKDFTWLNSSYSPVLKQLESQSMIDYYFRTHGAKPDGNLKYRNPKYLSMLNHLRFYLPEIFPKLNKVVFLDDDVVVQKDLTGLWNIDLKGMVNGAIETCGESFHRFDKYLNFSNPLISKNFDPHACGWAYGMNVFDLVEWRKQNITNVYHSWQTLNQDRQLWQLGSLPPGLISFYNRTLALDRSWHVLGLGYDENVKETDLDHAAVIHYNGNKKPWLEIGMEKYRKYWSKYVNYDQIYLHQCNIVP
ncbi:probable galacturonosyltransferase 4 isoform X2 [Asparagus officinalis]|nr:probable galacturonosyltransferase 4 isoform X1 [Asparagus officinalis]XP_020267379.1 probable galacturonosyltransferase 4 isoform X2 [Asparagus officinalis]